MTANQTIALLFPFFAAGAVALTVLLIVQPWKRKKPTGVSETAILPGDVEDDRREADEVSRKIGQLSDQLQQFARQIQNKRARTPST